MHLTLKDVYIHPYLDKVVPSIMGQREYLFVLSEPNSTYFSMEINHGGYFLGSDKNMSYVDGAVIWYDQVDTLTWSVTTGG